jgi:hypothetical protein
LVLFYVVAKATTHKDSGQQNGDVDHRGESDYAQDNLKPAWDVFPAESPIAGRVGFGMDDFVRHKSDSSAESGTHKLNPRRD